MNAEPMPVAPPMPVDSFEMTPPLIDEASVMEQFVAEAPKRLSEPDLGAKKAAPIGAKTKEQRDRLAMRIAEAINLGISQKGTLDDRNRRNEEFYENRIVQPPVLPHPNAPYFHIPVTKPRVSKRKAALVQTITQQETVFRFKRIGKQQNVKEVEQCIQFALDAQNWEQDLDILAQHLLLVNNVLIRVTFQEHLDGFEKATHTGAFAGPVIDIIHPSYASIFPATPGPMDKKRVIAHMSEIRAGDIEAEQRRGYYFKDAKVIGGDQRMASKNAKVGSKQNVEAEYSEPEDANINLWDGLWRDDLDGKGERWYRVIMRVDHVELYRIEEYPTELPIWYVMAQIDKEAGVLWTEGSPAQDLQGMQILMNDTVNRLVWAIERLGSLTVIGEGDIGDGGDLRNLPPNSFVPVRKLGKTLIANGAASLQGADILVNMVMQFANSSGTVSETLTGAQANKESTATEENIKLMGFQLAGSSDLMAISPALCQMAKLMLAMIGFYWDRYVNVYGDALAVKDGRTLRLPYTIELAGKAPEDAPQTQIEQAKLLLETALNFPQEGIPVSELVRAIVLNSGLNNKEDLLAAMDQVFAQQHMMDQMMNPDAILAALTGSMQNGAGGPGEIDPALAAQILGQLGVTAH